MKPSSSDSKTVQHQYDSFIKKNLKGEAKSYNQELYKRSAREILFSEMSEAELGKLYTVDEYDSDFYKFSVLGYDIKIKNDLIGEALCGLPPKSRDVVLMSYFLDMSDDEIGKLQNVVRSTIFRQRKNALKNIEKYMEGKADVKHSKN